MNFLRLFPFVLLFIFTTGAWAEMTVSPRNTVHVIGDPNPVLECEFQSESFNDGLQWIEYVTSPDTTQGYAISLNETVLHGYEESYRIVNEFHLEVLDPDVTAAGWYDCRNLLAPQVCGAAELLILVSGLHSSTNASDVDYVIMAGETVRFECSVEHSGGDWLPEITFANSQGGIEDSSFDCRIPTDGENVMRQCIDIVIDPVNGKWLYSCEVRYPAPPTPDYPTCLYNPIPPDFAQNFTFPALTVHFGPRYVKILPPDGSHVEAGDVLRCFAVSNPPPVFHQWFDSDLEVIQSNSSSIVVPEECEGIEQLCVTCLVLVEDRDGNIGQAEAYNCYNSTEPEKVRPQPTEHRKATCWNPERRNLHPRLKKQATNTRQKDSLK